MPTRNTGQPTSNDAIRGHISPRFDPLKAASWAEAIVAFWRGAHASGMVDSAKTLDIFDLMPGRGEAAWLLTQALHRSLKAFPELNVRLRYFLVAPRRELLSAVRGQEEFQTWIHDESLVPVLWDPERGEPCLLTPHKRLAWEAANPAVVLAHDMWARLEQRLLAVHYGALLEADIAALASNTRSEDEAKLWRPAREHDLPEGVAHLARECLSRFNSVPLPLPIGAIKLASSIVGLAKHGYLLLANADGVSSAQQLRLQTFPALVARHRQGHALPVNFYLMAKYLESHGAATWQSGAAGSSVMHAAIGAMPHPERMRDAVAASLSESGGSDADALVALARAATGRAKLSSEPLLALLRSSEFDPEVFIACSGVIMELLKLDAALDRAPWRDALQQVWQRHLPLPEGMPLHRMLAPALMRAGAWGSARSILRRGLQVHGNDVLDLAHLAWCDFRTGRLREAEEWIRRALAISKMHAVVNEVASKIEDKLQRLKGGWLQIIPGTSLPEICLEPLDIGHVEALYHQYRDPQIAIMTGLPALASLDSARDWVNGHLADATRRAYAVMHVDHGFVGYACMAVSGTIAYFCFWIGVDHQGSGYAAEVARMTCEHAKRQGMTHIYTSAYDDNARSLRSLERSGFHRLPIRALPPDNDRKFLFMQGAGDPVVDPCADLVAYYRDEQLPLKFPESERTAERSHGSSPDEPRQAHVTSAC